MVFNLKPENASCVTDLLSAIFLFPFQKHISKMQCTEKLAMIMRNGFPDNTVKYHPWW